jgi:uncharacterized RDD family membrane protein YckC
MKRASVFTRFVAFLVDLGFLLFVSLFLFISGLAGYILGMETITSFSGLVIRLRDFSPVFSFFAFVLFLFYFTYFTAHGDRTLGKALLGIRVVKRRDGGDIGIIRSLLRTLFYWVSAFPFFMGFFIAFVLRGRTLHDLLAGTMVIKEE